MANATIEELHKLSTMKLTITFFTSKLENFINETNATDENLLMLLSHLTDTIQSFVLAAKVIRTNHTIESVIDKSLLSCENIFECHACNVQTGKTYNSVINHTSSAKHIARAKQLQRQKDLEIPPKNIVARPTISINSINPSPGLLPLPAINNNHAVHNWQPLLQNHILGMYQQTPGPSIQPRAILARPITSMNHQLPLNANQISNQIHSPSVINNALPVNGIGNNNQFPSHQFSSPQFSSPDYFLNYKELFRMPPPVNVVGFQQNVVSSSNDFLRQLNTVQSNEESDKTQSHTKTRSRRRRRVKAKDFNNESKARVETKFFDEVSISFLKCNYEDEIIQFIDAAKKLSSDELYADITKNLKELCKEMDLDVDVKCFGSRIIGIGSDKSDIDLNISVTDCDLTTDNFLQKLLDILSKDSNWCNAIYIKSRVALVRAHNVKMNIDCDITFNNELAMSNTELMKYFYQIQPESRKLVLFIRMLAEKVKLHPQINTYTINLLVFYFFQIKGYLPKVLDLIETPTIKYWPNKFALKTVEELNIKMPKSFKLLCLDFLHFYAYQVNFEVDVLSTFTGSAIPKNIFGTNEYRVNDCFNGLLQYMKDNARAAECIRTNFKMAMCIQDPFSHDHNVSRCVGKLNLKRFKECCDETYNFLCSNANLAEKYSC